MRVWMVGLVALFSVQASARDVEDYSYDAVCATTKQYMNDLDDKIDRKEWGDIRKRAGRTREPGFYRYSNRDFSVDYDMQADGTPMIERVHFKKARVPYDMLSQADFMRKFDIAGAERAPQMTLYCDMHSLEARFSGGRMTDFIIHSLSDV